MTPISSKPVVNKASYWKRLWQQIWKRRTKYLMIIPALVFFLVFAYLPMVGVLQAVKEPSFTKGFIRSPWANPWYKYFKQFFNNYQLGTLVTNTLRISILRLITGFPAPIILAILLNELRSTKFKRVVQSVSYVPHFISWAVVVSMLNQLLSPNGGPVNSLMSLLNPEWEPYWFMGEEEAFLPVLLISGIWKGLGWSTIVYLAAIAGINTELYEAAYIDGAGRIRMAFSITLPCISGTIGLLFITGVGGLVAAGYDPIYLMQSPANKGVSEVIDTYIMNVGIKSGRFSLATAAGVVQGALAMMLVVITNFIFKRTTEISMW
ncbi:MAG: sugar ABC transporter permease [Clostridia bacterium]|nr:sugar ABC transporter permease [Clostridia bacterium]